MDALDGMIDELLMDLQDMEQSDAKLRIRNLESENSILAQEIKAQKHRISLMHSMFHQAETLFQTLSDTRESFYKQRLAAEESWLAFWGIHNYHTAPLFSIEDLSACY